MELDLSEKSITSRRKRFWKSIDAYNWGSSIQGYV